MNLLNDLKAPLFAELDVSNVQNYIDTKIDTRLDRSLYTGTLPKTHAQYEE
jgi:hypothetical protein